MFPSDFFGFSAESSNYMSDVTMNCPVCGGMAVMASGGYVTGTDAEVVALPKTEFDADLLRRAGIFVQELLDDGVPTHEIVDRLAEEVSPEVAQQLRGMTRKQVKKWVKKVLAGAAIVVGTEILNIGTDALLSRDAPPPAVEHIVFPEGSEGTVTQSDGTVMR